MFLFAVGFILLMMASTCRPDVIQELEYSKMPKLFTLDDFRDCMLQPTALYCVIDIELKTSSPSELWYQIKNFSANSLKHYRHDILHKGLCIAKRCNVSDDDISKLINDKEMLKASISECINNELKMSYGFEGDVKLRYCEHNGSTKREFDNGDWFYLSIVLGILLINIIGTVYQVKSKNDGKENQFLVALSIALNWKKLMSRTAFDANSSEKRKKSLNGIQGLRFLTMIAVIFSHVLLIISYGYVENTMRVEEPYDDPMMHLVYNGSLVVQTFFCMSSFLMAYNFLLYADKNSINSFWTYFLVIFQRWLRLTPVYALVIGFLCTVYEKLGTGPLWQYIIGDDADSCRRWWWTNLLYINNYVGEGQLCLGVTWYLAADTQLFCYGMLVMMVMWKFPSITRLFFGFLMAIAILLPGVLTYRNGYYPTVPQGPEAFRTLYQNDPTFKNIYTTVAGNMGGYTLGLIGGTLHYYMEKNGTTLTNKKWFKMWYYLTFPLGLALIFSGVLFYKNDYVYNPMTAAAYASLYKVAFAILLTSFILGVTYKCDNVIRGLVEWSGYQIAGRLTYCAYLIHTIPQRYIVGLLKHPYDLIDYNVICMFVSSITLTYFISVGLCVFVEIPCNNIQKILFQSGSKSKISNSNQNNNVQECNTNTKSDVNHVSNSESDRNENIEVEIELNNKGDHCSKL